MNTHFQQMVDARLEPQLQRLISMTPKRYSDLPRQIPKRAVYLFSEGGEHLYVGRTNHLRNRLRGHCDPSASHYSAAFALRLAHEDAGLIKATYESAGTSARRKDDPVFDPVFAAARVRVSRMELRYVKEDDPITLALLQTYVVAALQTRYNDRDIGTPRVTDP